MRRIGRVGLVVCLLLFLGARAAFAIAPGDINDDGAWDARDALLLERYLQGEATLGAAQLEAADVAPLGLTGPTAGNDTVDAGDLVVLLRLVGDDDLDGDGLSAAFEVANGFSPLVTDEDGNGVVDGLDDSDRDGLINADEERTSLDPHDSDSDDDGFLDALEFATPPSQAVATNASTSTQFLFDEAETGNTPLQNDATVSEIDPAVLAVLRGAVKSRAGAPIAGTRISVLGHPEFGTTTTRGDGMFDLAVNGGGTLTVVYDHPDHLAVQRKVQVPWQDYVFLPDVVLIPVDTAHTDIDLENPPAPIQVAQGSVSTDASGSRRPVLLFREGTIATATLVDGSTEELKELRVRATEYTVGENGPEAMPGDLPPQSAYTYAVEFTVDEARELGAKKVAFSLPTASSPIKEYPVSAYLENFLGLPVGTPIPNGYYDHEKGAWLPEKSGLVLKVVGVTGGRADLDVTGDGNPDATAALGISDDERATLDALYDAGDELWWVPLAHFSDFNMAPSLPATAEAPPVPVPNGQAPPSPCEVPNASTIVCESQVLLETVPVADTPFALAYASDRTPGYTAAYTLRFPLRGTGPLPPEVQAVGLEVSIAGREYEFSYTPAEVNADGEEEIQWNGTDGYGRLLQGRQPVTAQLRYEYVFGYQSTGTFGQAGNGTAIGGAQPRTGFTVRQPWFGFVGGWDARGAGLGGWTLSPHHTYDPYSRVLYTGDGRQRRAEQLPDVIDTVAGGGTQWPFPASGLPATKYRFTGGFQGRPGSIATAPDGSFFVTEGDLGYQVVYKIDRDGWMTRFAGGGSDFDSEGIAATSAELKQQDPLQGLAVGPDGALYIATGHRIRKVTPDGKIWTVAGRANQFTYNGDGIPATEANLNWPHAIALAPDNSLYIVDTNNGRIRRVDPNGIIETVAGNGSSGAPIENGPAAQAALCNPQGIALDAAGNLYISSFTCDRVWRVTPDGILRRFAGTGASFGELGDGGPAVGARLVNPKGLVAAPDGSVYITTENQGIGDHRIRRVAPNGLITSVAGTGPAGSTGDGGPAAAALVNSPFSLAMAADGSLYLADLPGLRVRKIQPAFPGAAAGTVSITSEDGRERYEFDSSGKHLVTYETIGNTPLYTFGYDADDRLVSITDGDANVTTIEHDAQGEPTAIVAPFGQRTELETDAARWLSSITDPAGGEHGLATQPDGLLTGYTDPNGANAVYEYGDYGYLEKDTDRAEGWKELARTDSAGLSEVTVTSRLGRANHYRTERLQPSGDEVRTLTDPAGLVITQLRDADEERTVTSPTGVVSVSTPAPDFRFGMAAPIPGSQTITTPGGRTLTRTMTRTGDMDDTTGVLTDQTDTLVVNTRSSTAVWDHDAAVTWNGGSLGRRRTTSAANPARILEEALDVRGRPIGSRLGTLHPVKMVYDTSGRIGSITHGPGGAGDRVTTFAYHPTTGRLASITDPASRITTFDQYDLAGRVEQMTLPGNRVVAFGYDANGNLTSLSPPGRPAHVFRYTAVDQEEEYEPPAVTGITDPKTVNTYDLDRSLDLVTRPDGKTVDLAYEAASGRLDTVTIAEGVYDYEYHATTDVELGKAAGQLDTLTAPAGQTLAYGWDGELPTSTTWSGPVAGSVERSFDNDFRVATETVNGAHTMTFQFDPDSLLDLVDQASGPDLDLVRNPTTGFGAGLLTGTTQGVIATAETPSAFGELATVAATANGSSLYGLDVSDRDALGRIETKVETVGGVATTAGYTYDDAGRLDTVTVGGSLVADYAYDTNGNRTKEREDLGGSAIAAYDDQDRLTSYAGTTYTYSEAGDLETKTDGSGVTTFAYDALGNLRSALFPDGKRVEYGIDGQNRRVGKKVCPAPCTGGATAQPTQGFLYGDQLRIIAELDGANQVVSRFVYASRPNVPDFLVKGGTSYRILSDQVGSVRLVVNADTGAVAQRIDYDVWGNPTYVIGSPEFQPFGFAGGLTDHDTGLVRFGARDYDPAVGRWTNKDPIGFAGNDENLYGYSLGDAVNVVDPSGTLWFAQGNSVGGGFRGGTGSESRGRWVNPTSGDYGSYTSRTGGAGTPGASATTDFSFGGGDDPGGEGPAGQASFTSPWGPHCSLSGTPGADWSLGFSLGVGYPPGFGWSVVVTHTSTTTDGNYYRDLWNNLSRWARRDYSIPME